MTQQIVYKPNRLHINPIGYKEETGDDRDMQGSLKRTSGVFIEQLFFSFPSRKTKYLGHRYSKNSGVCIIIVVSSKV